MSDYPIAKSSLMFVGERLTFIDCELKQATCYGIPKAQSRWGETELFRHVFRSPVGTLVYTGKDLRLKLRQSYAIVATIKRFETWGPGPNQNHVRLCRVKVLKKFAVPLGFC
jgi:hypothetical protein